MTKILIVDSSLLDRKRIRTMLEAAGHAAVEMSSPVQVMEDLPRFAPGSVKLVVTELQFPDISGLELIRWLKQSSTYKNVPVLVVTTQQPRDILIELVAAGASTIVTKPFGGDMLLRRVTETLSEHSVLCQGQNESLTWQLQDYLRRECKRAERTGSSFSVVVCRVLDMLDGQALPHLMRGLNQIMRESDILARLGDDQAVILLPDTDWAGAAVVEGRVRTAVMGLSEGEGKLLVPLRMATGAATFPSEANDGESLLALAVDRTA